jgi:hypothetical protein
MIRLLVALGAGIAAWRYRDEIQRYIERQLPTVRDRTREGKKVLEDRAEELLNKVTEMRRRYRPESFMRRGRERRPGPSERSSS